MSEIDILKKEEKRLCKELEKTRDKRDSLERASLAPELRKQFVGKFFKTRNSYGGDDKGWWLYRYILSLPDDFNIPNPDFKVFSFEAREDGNTNINLSTLCWQSILGKQITREEFMAAYGRMMETIKFQEG
jgi:hypothetical protein